MIWFQLIQCNTFPVSLFLYDSKLNIFVLWTKEDIFFISCRAFGNSGRHFSQFFDFSYTKQLMIKENNHHLQAYTLPEHLVHTTHTSISNSVTTLTLLRRCCDLKKNSTNFTHQSLFMDLGDKWNSWLQRELQENKLTHLSQSVSYQTSAACSSSLPQGRHLRLY